METEKDYSDQEIDRWVGVMLENLQKIPLWLAKQYADHFVRDGLNSKVNKMIVRILKNIEPGCEQEFIDSAGAAYFRAGARFGRFINKKLVLKYIFGRKSTLKGMKYEHLLEYGKWIRYAIDYGNCSDEELEKLKECSKECGHFKHVFRKHYTKSLREGTV